MCIRDRDDLLQQFKHYLFDNAKLVEQVLKDYYVYETWQLNDTLITLSHSNMGLLRRMEENEPDNLLREIVVHPRWTHLRQLVSQQESDLFGGIDRF